MARCATPLRVFRREPRATRARLAGNLGPMAELRRSADDSRHSICHRTDREGGGAAVGSGLAGAAASASVTTIAPSRRLAARGYLHPLYPAVYAVGHPALQTEGRLVGRALPRRPWRSAQPHDGGLVVAAARRDADRHPRHQPAPAAAAARAEVAPPPWRPRARVRAPPAGDARPSHPPRPRRDRRPPAPAPRPRRGRPPQAARSGGGRGRVRPRQARLNGPPPRPRDPSPGARPGAQRLRGRVPAARRAAPGLPIPEPNAVVEGFKVDALWRVERLVVELDGHATHANPVANEEDRRRELDPAPRRLPDLPLHVAAGHAPPGRRCRRPPPAAGSASRAARAPRPARRGSGSW